MRVALAAIALVVIAMMALTGYQAGLAGAGEETTITNESFTPTTTGTIILDESQRSNTHYDKTVAVYDDNGSRVQSASDYVWNDNNGTIDVVAGGELDGDASATITYAYRTSTAEQRAWTALLGQQPRVLTYLGIVLFAVFFISILQGAF